MRQYLKFFLVTILGVSTTLASGQEYDDLYFTKKDRVKKEKHSKKANEKEYIQDQDQPSGDDGLSFLGRQYQYDYEDVGNVSEESLEYYAPEKTQEDYQSESTQSAYINGTERNPNFSNLQGTFDNIDQQQPVVINNYYNDNWNRWNNPRWNVGFGWNSWGGNFWSVSFGNQWGWYDPFWDPWGPAWGWNVGWGWNRGWGWNAGWGWNRGWGWNDPFWCPPGYYGNYGRPIYVADYNRSGRRIIRGTRPARGSVSSRESRSSSGRRSGVASESSRRRNYNRQQADYLNRSRADRYSNGSRTVNSRSRGTSTSSSRYNSGSTRNSGNSSGRYSSGNRSNSNTNYNRTSNSSRSRNYGSSSGSRGSSRSSSVRTSGSSRSSGSVGRSRSSSGSSRSSGSRSSSGRSSSGRRGN